MRILMVEPGGREGVADYTQALAEALGARGLHVDVVTAADHVYRPAANVTFHGRVHYARGVLHRYRLSPVVNAVRFVLALPGIARLARRADVVHLQGEYFPPLSVLLALAVRLVRRPLVHTAHSTFDRGRSLAWAHRALHALTAHTIVHTRADVERLPPGTRSTVVPHGEYGSLARTGGPADRPAARAGLGVGEDELVVLLFGQLRSDKGIGDLIAALDEVPGIRLVLAGRDLGALSEHPRASTDPRVILEEGFVAMDRAAELFAAADVVALPYPIASQSGVLLLAYGFARPVVAYPVGGLAEAVVHGETGWLTERPDPAALAESLREAAAAGAAERERRGAAGARLAQERYAWPAIAAATEEVYEEARKDRTAGV